MGFIDAMSRSQKQSGLTEEETDTLAREAVKVIRAGNQDEDRAGHQCRCQRVSLTLRRARLFQQYQHDIFTLVVSEAALAEY